MKKVLCAILAAATLLLCACGGTAAPEQTPAVTTAPTAAPTPRSPLSGVREWSGSRQESAGNETVKSKIGEAPPALSSIFP